MSFKAKTVRSTTRVLACTLAVLFLLFFAQVATHSHRNGQNDASCQVCHGAHLTLAPAVSTLDVQALIAFETVRPNKVAFHQEFLLHDYASRAPPIVVL
ncbi:MAG TPA: DUF2946 family protein [Candidatus Acidoferrum sp.]|jgi:hypothetical protein|nr:DUF2946 family protein [Candidatus Acidoferrum sp.]